jgi:hypothetical protein
MKSIVLAIVVCFIVQSSAQVRNRCSNSQNGVTLTDLNSCEFFSVCNNRAEIRMQCPTGRWYDFQANVCLPRETARCWVEENNNNNNINNNNNDTGVYVCPSMGLSSLPHRNSCSKYIICINGQQIERECFNGLHWSTHWEQCMTPELAQCSLNIMRCPPQNNNLVFFPSQQSCSRYFRVLFYFQTYILINTLSQVLCVL